MPARLLFCLSALLLGLSPRLGRAQPVADAPIVVSPALFTPPNSAVLAQAQRSGIPLEGVAAARETRTRAGDAVVALATFFDGEKQSQWLIRFTVVELDPKEKEKPGRDTVLHTSSGRTFTFSTTRVALALETVGPFAANKTKENAPPKRARVVVNEEFLALGIHRVTDIFAAFRTFSEGPGKAEDYSYGFSNKPTPPEKVEAGRKLAERMGLTEEMERSFVGSIPALMEFFQIAKEAPGVRDILMAVLDKPPLWSMAKGVATGQLGFGFTFAKEGQGVVDSGVWRLGLAQTNAVALTLQIFGKPALALTLYAGEPRPPLRTTAGIVGLMAKSIKTPSRFVVIRLLSTQDSSRALVTNQD